VNKKLQTINHLSGNLITIFYYVFSELLGFHEIEKETEIDRDIKIHDSDLIIEMTG
jgi:hypothetical protein